MDDIEKQKIFTDSGQTINVPVINSEEIKEFSKQRFWCQYCKTWHTHYIGTGFRSARCNSTESPYKATGYFLRPLKIQ